MRQMSDKEKRVWGILYRMIGLVMGSLLTAVGVHAASFMITLVGILLLVVYHILLEIKDEIDGY
jgi:hypothetical protein